MKVLNFGSLNLDYVYTVDHFVQPGETLAANSRCVKHGGKGLRHIVSFLMRQLSEGAIENDGKIRNGFQT